ncbi:MAG: hypothetical protein F6K56_09975 [Moorea sp. SIO3G5]|nr:hypothetical protein [Moorena sp. SIO3G5]
MTRERGASDRTSYNQAFFCKEGRFFCRKEPQVPNLMGRNVGTHTKLRSNIQLSLPPISPSPHIPLLGGVRGGFPSPYLPISLSPHLPIQPIYYL